MTSPSPSHAAWRVALDVLRAGTRALALRLRGVLARQCAAARVLSLATTLLAVAAAAVATAAPDPGTQPPVRVVQVFVREGCPHCADAKRFVEQQVATRPGVQVVLRPVDTDPAARDELNAVSLAAGVWPPGVPTFVIGDRVMVGFDDAEHSGRELLRLIEGETSPVEPAVDSALFGTVSASQLGLPLFTLALGLIDGFNPCAMWVLLFLLSLLVRLRNRRRMALIAGTFVFISGAVYYAFMAAWLNVFLAVGLSRAVMVGLALLALAIGAINIKDFFVPRQGPSLSIPLSVRPALVARMQRLRQMQSMPATLFAVAALALAVNFVELLCTAGLPAVYTAVLSQQGLSPTAHYAYLGLYTMAYIADDSLMVAIAVAALGSRKLSERGGQLLKLVSGAVMLALGALLLLRPQWLM